MDYNNEINKVVGIIEKELGGNSAKIRALGIISINNEFLELSEDEAKIHFPPYGFLFEPGFFLNYSFEIDDIIQFWAEENFKADERQDKFKLKYRSTDVKSFGINARNIYGFKKTNLVACLSDVSVDDNHSDGVFYGLSDKYIIGKLRVKNGIVEPALHHRIQIWDRDGQNIIANGNSNRLLKEPIGDSITLDCMNDKQLFEWFRDLLKQIEPDYVKLLDKNASWRKELPNLFSKVDDERLEADKIRLKRIEDKFELISFTHQEIKLLVDNSENLKEAFYKIIDSHKQEFKNGYKAELEKFEAEINEKKVSLNKEITKLEEQKTDKEEEVTQLTETTKIAIEEIESLKKNKDRIIKDFSIIKEVLNSNDLTQTTGEQSYVVESIIPHKGDKVGNCKNLENDLKCQLCYFNINSNFSRKILDVVFIYDAILIKDIRIGVALAKATNNAKYIIQQVEPDWLHFKDFWNSGLGEIWQSAQNNPEICHFLILEDLNMSAPECYSCPLMDMLVGVRSLIPFGKSNFPKNLKILASYISYEEPEIGLPMNKDTFYGWGAVGFRGNIYCNDKTKFEPTTTFSTPEIFKSNIIDEFEQEEIKNDVQEELKAIFEL